MSFSFVTGGIESALEQARKVVGDQNVAVTTATIMQQCLKAGLLDEIHLDLAHILIHEGIRLFEPSGNPPVELERIRVVEGTGVTHLQFRVLKKP